MLRSPTFISPADRSQAPVHRSGRRVRFVEISLVTTTPATTASERELRMRAAVMAPRDPLPRKQRKLKGGTTSFMLAMHVLATVALLPQFWSWQGVVAFGVLYWATVLGVTLSLIHI